MTINGASLCEPHLVRTTVKSVFLVAFLLVTGLVWLSVNHKYIKPLPTLTINYLS